MNDTSSSERKSQKDYWFCGALAATEGERNGRRSGSVSLPGLRGENSSWSRPVHSSRYEQVGHKGLIDCVRFPLESDFEATNSLTHVFGRIVRSRHSRCVCCHQSITKTNKTEEVLSLLEYICKHSKLKWRGRSKKDRLRCFLAKKQIASLSSPAVAKSGAVNEGVGGHYREVSCSRGRVPHATHLSMVNGRSRKVSTQ